MLPILCSQVASQKTRVLGPQGGTWFPTFSYGYPSSQPTTPPTFPPPPIQSLSAAILPGSTTTAAGPVEKARIKELEKEITRLKQSVSALKNANARDKKKLSSRNKKYCSKYHMFEQNDPLVTRDAPAEIIAVACAFWEATKGLSKGVANGHCWTGKNRRKEIMIEFVKTAWDGSLYADLKKEFYEANKFPPLKIAHVMDENVNINYTSLDLFRSMEGNIKKGHQGTLCSSSKIKAIHKKISDEADNVLGAHFPERYKGCVWTCNPQKFCDAYFEDFYLSTRTQATKDNPWICSFTGDGLRCGVFQGAFAAGMKNTDPRLPSQQATGKTSNQSKHEYLIHTAAFLEEKETLDMIYPLLDEIKRIEDTGTYFLVRFWLVCGKIPKIAILHAT